MRLKSIQLFASDGNHNLQYQGKCKLQIDRISSMLIVEPESEEHKIKSAKFECGFVMNTNVLFVIAEQELNDFVLIFDEEERCKKVYDLIMGDKAPIHIDKDVLLNRFLVPLCNRFTQTDDSTIKLKNVVSHLVAKQEDEKEKNTTLMNNASNLSCTSDSAALSLNVPFDEGDNDRSSIPRKRRHSQLDGVHNACDNLDIPKQNAPRIYSQIVSHEQYQLCHVVLGMYIRQRLYIFTNSAKSQCYEHSWSHERKLYYCNGCEAQGKDVTAVFDNDENGLLFIKMEDKNHICTPLPYTATNYTKILKKPDYEIVENSNTGVTLIIFAENDKSRCWEFQAGNTKSIFSCCKCSVSATLVNKNSKNEYVELKNASHKCEYIPYEPEKYYQFSDYDLYTDFVVQTYIRNGQEKKKFITFDKADRNLCHIYHFHNGCFVCYSCSAKGIHVSAKMVQTLNGEERVMVPKNKHICKLRMYSELPKKEIILRPPDFEVMENTKNGIKKLFVFDSNDRNLCYVFGRHGKNTYYCRGCCAARIRKKNEGICVKEVRAMLCKDEIGEYFVRIKDLKHACEPRKYEPEKYAVKELQRCRDYFFFRRQIFPNSINVAIYHPEDKTLCYQLNYNKTQFYFLCASCNYKKNHGVVARIKKDENGKEYVNHDLKKHVCQPIKVSSICAPKFVILKREEINFDERKKKKLETDENKVIKSENFQLCPNQKGVPDASLLIFHSEDRNMGFKYNRRNDRNYYTCWKKPQCYATAKLEIQENGEMYVVLGKTEHKCELDCFMQAKLR